MHTLCIVVYIHMYVRTHTCMYRLCVIFACCVPYCGRMVHTVLVFTEMGSINAGLADC
jgi:hypothetical protein